MYVYIYMHIYIYMYIYVYMYICVICECCLYMYSTSYHMIVDIAKIEGPEPLQKAAEELEHL